MNVEVRWNRVEREKRWDGEGGLCTDFDSSNQYLGPSLLPNAAIDSWRLTLELPGDRPQGLPRFVAEPWYAVDYLPQYPSLGAVGFLDLLRHRSHLSILEGCISSCYERRMRSESFA